ncbi:MAG: transcription initiation factor IIB family protein [Candidatus Nitrosopolaris sp.]
MDLNSQQILQDFHVLKNSLGLSERILDRAKYVITEANKKGLVRGRTYTTIVAAAVYIASRDTENPHPLHDIATIANVKRKTLARYCRTLMNKLHLNFPAIDPSKCVMRLADMINANERAKRLAAIMMNEIVNEEKSAGKNPMAVAASILYICCKKTGYHTSQSTIAKAAGITEVTLRNRFRELRRMQH